MDSSHVDDQAMPNAAMMDPTMEDLFGDAADSLNVSIPPAPLPAALILRIAEMQSRGCCTKLAWSNTGSIARISPDGSKICFLALVRDKKTTLWKVRESDHPIQAPEGRKFVHLSFSGIGIELAAVDSVGTVNVYTLPGPLGRMMSSFDGLARETGSKNELNAVVGLHWLPLFQAEFRGPFVDAAVKNGDKWSAQLRPRDQNNIRAHHPAEGRHALFHITCSGELTLLYQNEGWQSTTVSLEPVRSSSEAITHADMCEDGADMLAITHDQSSRFRLYRISISWNATQQSRGPINITLVAPTLEVHHLTACDNVRAQHADAAKLTHLRIIPTVTEAAHAMPNQTTVVAVFTHAALPSDSAQSSTSFSAIARWQVESFTPTLHEAFKKLKPGGNSTAVLNAVTVLSRQPDTVTNKVILTLQPQAFDTIFAFGASDGSVEFRDRVSMDILHAFGDTNTVASLAQSGFDHMAGEHNVHIATSSDSACIAVVRVDGKMDAHPMIFSQGWQALDETNKPFIEAGAVCIARQCTFLSYNNMSNDEDLALLPADITPELRTLVIRTMFDIIQRKPDVSMMDPRRQQIMVLQDPIIPRSLSAQLALGTNPFTGRRNSRAQFAFASLNIRLAATSVAQALSRPDVVKNLAPDAINSLRGLVRWTTDLLICVANTLTTVRRDLEAGTSAKQAFERLASTTGNPSLHLLLSSFTRALLRYSSQLIGKYFMLLQQVGLGRARTIEERQEMQSSLDTGAKIPFKLSEFEKMAMEVDQTVREIFTKNSMTNDRRTEIEISLMVEDAIPNELEPAVDAIMNTILPKLIESTDMSRLYFWDTEWLGLTSSKPAPGGKHFDVHRKVPIPPGVPMRWCRRCGSMAEDWPPEKLRELPQWLVHAQRHCVCLNYWLLA